MFYGGIDPSFENTALVVLDAKLDLAHVAESKSVKKLRTAKPGVKRLCLFHEWMLAEVEKFARKGPVCIGYEDYSYGSTHKGETMGELGGALKLALVRSKARELFLAAPTEVKRFAVGNGQASKDLLYRKAVDEAGKRLEGCNHDVSDAYFLAKLCAYCALGNKTKDPFINRDRVKTSLKVKGRKAMVLN